MRRMSPQDTAGHPRTASERLAAALGRPAPRKLAAAERAGLERRQDAADADAERVYGIRGQSAA